MIRKQEEETEEDNWGSLGLLGGRWSRKGDRESTLGRHKIVFTSEQKSHLCIYKRMI